MAARLQNKLSNGTSARQSLEFALRVNPRGAEATLVDPSEPLAGAPPATPSREATPPLGAFSERRRDRPLDRVSFVSGQSPSHDRAGLSQFPAKLRLASATTRNNMCRNRTFGGYHCVHCGFAGTIMLESTSARSSGGSRSSRRIFAQPRGRAPPNLSSSAMLRAAKARAGSPASPKGPPKRPWRTRRAARRSNVTFRRMSAARPRNWGGGRSTASPENGRPVLHRFRRRRRFGGVLKPRRARLTMGAPFVRLSLFRRRRRRRSQKSADLTSSQSAGLSKEQRAQGERASSPAIVSREVGR